MSPHKRRGGELASSVGEEEEEGGGRGAGKGTEGVPQMSVSYD